MATYCRFCGEKLKDTFIDLGVSPLANSYVDFEKANLGEVFFPLRANICGKCKLVQLDEYESPGGIFSNYAYLSSYSESWLNHSRMYVDKMIEEYGFDEKSQIVEIASNDGYLLQYFAQRNIPVLGIEPAANAAEIAQKKGIKTLVDFFGRELALKLKIEGIKANLIVANNVLAHVPDLNSFVSGIDTLLSEDGIVTVEFPYLIRLIEESQFDTIYHEHFSYFSFMTVQSVFNSHNMRIYRVEKLPTHGGSLRVYACHRDNKRIPDEESVENLIKFEHTIGADSLEYYLGFHNKVENIKMEVLSFLIEQKRKKKKVCGYGAPAKGNTLLNYCGIGVELMAFTVDKNPLKQHTFLPGSRIPVYSPEKIEEYRPDYVVILPWNIKNEVIAQESVIRSWGGRFVTFIPKIDVV